MGNYELLNRYKKRLSIYFAFFILCSIWIVVLFFDISKYFNSVRSDKKFLSNKSDQIEHIMDNASVYYKFHEVTFRRILKKIIEDTRISSGDDEIFSEITDFDNFSILPSEWFLKVGDYIYLKTIYEHNNKNYEIIVRKKIEIKFEDFLKNYFYLLLFSFPFGILFYFLGILFVWKNLIPIKETIKNLEDFTWNVNHEFKTPITEIISSLELSKKTWIYEKAVNQSINSAKKIDRLLDSLLWMVSITDSSYKKQRIDMVSYSKEIIEEYKAIAEVKDIVINFESSKECIMRNVNKEHYHICFANLLSNAIKYSDSDSMVEIKLSKKGLMVRDFWIWIDKKNLEKIFSRYFRENYIDGAWKGIWLSLTKKICDMNDWKIKIESHKEWKHKWTTISIDFD